MKKILVMLMAAMLFVAGCSSSSDTDSQPAPAAPEATQTAPADEATADDVTVDDETATDEMATTEAAPSPWAALLTGQTFALTSLDGEAFIPPATEDGTLLPLPTMVFGDWPQLSGTICNNYTGQVEVTGNTLALPQAATTLMACDNEALNQLETDFYALIASGLEMTLEGDILTLAANGRTMVFTKQN
ncbi:MAG: META domain-containing protein [Candidatus Adiutrix sp.]